MPGCRRSLIEHVLGRDVEHADLGRHHHEAVLGHRVARGAQAVAVEHRADLPPVGEGHGGRAVPRLHQERVVLVVGAQVGIHVVPVLPRLRDHHQHGFGELATRQHQELERVVEARRVARAFAHDRIEPLQVFAEQRRGHRAFAGVHPVLVAADRVDLAVVREVAERVREIPRAEGVGAVARVHEAHGRGEVGVHHVGEEARDLRRDQHADVGDGPAGEARHVEEVAAARLGARLALDQPPDQVEPPLEGVGVLGLAPARRDEDLPDARQAGAARAGRSRSDRAARRASRAAPGLRARRRARRSRPGARLPPDPGRGRPCRPRSARAPAARSRAPCTRVAGTRRGSGRGCRRRRPTRDRSRTRRDARG